MSKPKMVPFGPLKLPRSHIAELREAAADNRSQASIVRELIEAWFKARKKPKDGS